MNCPNYTDLSKKKSKLAIFITHFLIANPVQCIHLNNFEEFCKLIYVLCTCKCIIVLYYSQDEMASTSSNTYDMPQLETPSRRSKLADRTSSLLSQLHPGRWVRSHHEHHHHHHQRKDSSPAVTPPPTYTVCPGWIWLTLFAYY